MAELRIEPGFELVDRDRVVIGPVDAVFADYLLVRAGFPPVDVHVPTDAVTSVHEGRVWIDASRAEATDGRWDRPPMRPHGAGRRTATDEQPPGAR